MQEYTNNIERIVLNIHGEFQPKYTISKLLEEALDENSSYIVVYSQMIAGCSHPIDVIITINTHKLWIMQLAVDI